jgi:zinc protease
VEIEQIELLINEEVERLQEEGVTERELQKAKNQFRTSQIMGRQTVFAKTQELQHYRFFHNDVAEINTDLDRYNEVTVEEIMRVARDYLVSVNRTVVIAVPAGGEEEDKKATTSSGDEQ